MDGEKSSQDNENDGKNGYIYKLIMEKWLHSNVFTTYDGEKFLLIVLAFC